MDIRKQLLTVALVTFLASCTSTHKQYSPSSHKEFLSALGQNKYSHFTPGQKKDLEENWLKVPIDKRITSYNIYNDPEAYLSSLSSDERREFSAFNVSDWSPEELEDVKIEMPWINDFENLSLEDQLILFELDKMPLPFGAR